MRGEKFLSSIVGDENILQRSVRWNGTGRPVGRLTAEMFSNATVVGMGLILFYYWTIIIFSNNSIVGMGLSAGMPAGGALAGQARCARGGRVPVEEPCTRRPEGGKPAVIPPSGLSLFPHGACFVGGFTIQWMKGRVVVIQVVRTTLETLSHMNFYSRGGCFFRCSHRLCDSGIVDGVPQRASDARLNELRRRKCTDVQR